jgi:hypothetical protein
MKYHERIDGGSGRAGWKPIAIAAAAILGAALCAGCLYTIVPAMAGPSTTYPQSADSQPSAAPSPQPSNQTNQGAQANSAAPGAVHP